MFLPILPTTGIGGWRYVERTYDNQVRLFAKSPQIDRDIQYFKEKIANVTSARDLVQDRRLLGVALGAFGLADDINNRYFIQKILEEGTTATDSLANRFSDNRYKSFSKAFALGPGEKSPVKNEDFAANIIEKFKANAFEEAIGDQDENMRIALYAKRVLADLVAPPVKPKELVVREEVAGLVDDFVASISDEADYFERKVRSIATVDELLADRTLLKFALSTFGLQEDFDAIASFVPAAPGDVNEAEEKIRAVLAEGSISVVARANQLGDSRYVELSRAFGFGIAEDLQSNDLGFGAEMLDRYVMNNFEIPEGLDFDERFEIVDGKITVEEFTAKDMSNDAKWLTIMGEPPLRILFERAFNLPTEFGQADIDQQLVVFKARARREFGTDDLAKIAQDEKVENLVIKFLARSQISAFNAATSPGAIALTLLQSRF